MLGFAEGHASVTYIIMSDIKFIQKGKPKYLGGKIVIGYFQ